MIASVIAITLNLIGNYLFIYGRFGLPEMACAARPWRRTSPGWWRWVCGGFIPTEAGKIPVYSARLFQLPRAEELILKSPGTGSPLLLNEVLWAIGTTFVNQSYSTRGLTVVAR
jgi:Na+-driven multidrug efflux pump